MSGVRTKAGEAAVNYALFLAEPVMRDIWPGHPGRCPLARMSGTKVDGETVDLRFRMTLGLRRFGGTRKIVHLHEAVPFQMHGSCRAAVNLGPAVDLGGRRAGGPCRGGRGRGTCAGSSCRHMPARAAPAGCRGRPARQTRGER